MAKSKLKKVWEATDGKTFVEKEDAETHQRKVDLGEALVDKSIVSFAITVDGSGRECIKLELEGGHEVVISAEGGTGAGDPWLEFTVDGEGV